MLHYNPRHVSSINMPVFRRANCIITAPGIVTLCKRLYSMPDESRLQNSLLSSGKVRHVCYTFVVIAFNHMFLFNGNILWLWVFIKLSHCISWPMNHWELSSMVARLSAINTHWWTGRILKASQFHIFYISVSWKLRGAGEGCETHLVINVSLRLVVIFQ